MLEKQITNLLIKYQNSNEKSAQILFLTRTNKLALNKLSLMYDSYWEE